MKNHIGRQFFGLKDPGKFFKGIQQAINALKPGGTFSGDNLFTFGRNLSFLDDPKFMTAYEKHAQTVVEKDIIWRTHVMCWGAFHGLKRPGDFVECGAYKGTTARIICDYLDLGRTDKSFYLFDLFEHEEEMNHHAMPEHGEGLFDQVKARFEDLPNVQVFQGPVPESFSQGIPDRIAFLHIDMNNAAAEVGALEVLFDRVSDGAIIVLDDYGWNGYRDQKEAEDEFFAKQGYKVVELPTGQGMVVK